MSRKIVYGIEIARLDVIRWALDRIIEEHGHGTTASDITFEQETYDDGTILSTHIEITVEVP